MFCCLSSQAFQLSAEEEAALLRLAEEQQELLFADKQKGRWLQQWVEPQGRRHADLLPSRRPPFWPSSSLSSPTTVTGVASGKLKEGKTSVGAREANGRFSGAGVESCLSSSVASSSSFSPSVRRLGASGRPADTGSTGLQPSVLKEASEAAAPKTTSGKIPVKETGRARFGSSGTSDEASRCHLVLEKTEHRLPAEDEQSRSGEESDKRGGEQGALAVPSLSGGRTQGLPVISSGGAASAGRPRRVAIPKGAFKTVRTLPQRSY